MDDEYRMDVTSAIVPERRSAYTTVSDRLRLRFRMRVRLLRFMNKSLLLFRPLPRT
jgi:hypothetical protein